jgi:hypothetical protein
VQNRAIGTRHGVRRRGNLGTVEASEVASIAIANASKFVAAMEALTPAGFEAIDAAIDRIVRMSDDEVEAGVRDAAVSALTLMLGRVPLD